MEKNQSVEIKFVGEKKTIFNVVSYEQFEKVYKPNGWVLKDGTQPIELDDKDIKDVDNSNEEEAIQEDTKEGTTEEKPIEKIVEELNTTDESTIKNINTMKKKSSDQKFNDNIMKE